jgi:S-adenosylmethionine hydrolase
MAIERDACGGFRFTGKGFEQVTDNLERALEWISGAKIVLITDCIDVSVNEMRLALTNSYRKHGGTGDVLSKIEPTVACLPFNITHAAFLTRLVAEVSPPGTVIMTIVNPMRDRPQRILGLTKNGIFFEGPNTGAFSWLVEDFGVERCFELTDPGFVPFGGKHVHAPSVGALMAGLSPTELGLPLEPDYKPVDSICPRGTIVHIDNFGNAKLKFASDEFHSTAPGSCFNVVFPGDVSLRAKYGVRMMEFEDDDWVLYPGSSLGLLELGQVRNIGLLSTNLGRVGDRVHLSPASANA